MVDDPYKAPAAKPDQGTLKPSRTMVFALLSIIAVAAVIGIQNYRHRVRMREAALLRQLQKAAAEADKATKAAQLQLTNSSVSVATGR